jgi:hypothetical protein
MAGAVARLDRTVSDMVAAHGGVRPVEQARIIRYPLRMIGFS